MATDLTLFELSYSKDVIQDRLPSPLGAVEHGEVFTRRWVADLILDLVGYTSDRNLVSMRAVEPACGSGAFLVPMVERLLASAHNYEKSMSEAANAIQAFDLVEGHVARSRDAVRTTLLQASVEPALALYLTDSWLHHADYLLSEQQEKSVDFVIGNPPYVRIEAIPTARQKRYRQKLTTMGGRADIFVGFYEQGLRSLTDDGALAFICADRWMRNSYGRNLRRLITSSFSVEFVLSLHDVDAFEEVVSAYPAITLLRRRSQGEAVIADASGEFGSHGARELLAWKSNNVTPSFDTNEVAAARLPRWFAGDQSWPTGSPSRLSTLADLERRFQPLESRVTETKVGIGVATGSDSVFVVSAPPDVEESRRLPLVMTSDVRSGTLQWSGHYLVNPWDEKGLVDLDRYPRLHTYYTRNRAALRSRHIASRQPFWYRTIDRVNTSLTNTPKLLFADMSMRIGPVLDEGGFYPHHNLYWITSRTWDLSVLGGLLLSDVAELFVSSYCVKMRGGTLRFQAQYLRRIRVPEYSSIPFWARSALAQAFQERDIRHASSVAAELYGTDAGQLGSE